MVFWNNKTVVFHTCGVLMGQLPQDPPAEQSQDAISLVDPSHSKCLQNLTSISNISFHIGYFLQILEVENNLW